MPLSRASARRRAPTLAAPMAGTIQALTWSLRLQIAKKAPRLMWINDNAGCQHTITSMKKSFKNANG